MRDCLFDYDIELFILEQISKSLSDIKKASPEQEGIIRAVTNIENILDIERQKIAGIIWKRNFTAISKIAELADKGEAE